MTEIYTPFGLHQFVDTPIHERGGILDVIVAPIDSPPVDIAANDVGVSDRMLVSWTINLTPPLPAYITTTRRSWKTEDFMSRIRSSALCTSEELCMDVDQLTTQYNPIITELLDDMAR